MLISRRDERPVVTVKKNAMPQLTWKDDSLVIYALAKRDLLNVNNIAMAEFHINLDIALKFGLVVEKTVQNVTTYLIGPNLQYILPKVTYNEHTMPTGDPFRTYYNWEGEQYTGVNYVNEPFQVVTLQGVKFLKLHLRFEWQLNNLDASFEKMVGTKTRQDVFHRFPARKNVHIFLAAILAEQPFDRGTGVKLNEWRPVATGYI